MRRWTTISAVIVEAVLLPIVLIAYILEKIFLSFRCLLALIVVISLSSCATVFDSPRLLIDNGDFHAVDVKLINSSLEVAAYSTLRIYSDQNGKMWAKRDLITQAGTITRDCFINTCWAIRTASPSDTMHCSAEWNAAIKEMLLTEFYLLGGIKPTPVNLTVILIPSSDGFIGSFAEMKRKRLPITFVFHDPDEGTCSHGLSTRKLSSNADLIHITDTVSYELQHIEYALGSSKGPKPRLSGAGLVKDEANSTCWMYSIDAALKLNTNDSVRIPVINDETNRLLKYFTGGQDISRSAALIGPSVIWRDLTSYLSNQDPALRTASKLVVEGTDHANIEHILQFCRAFTLYKENVLNHPMPINIVTTQPTPNLSSSLDFAPNAQN